MLVEIVARKPDWMEAEPKPTKREQADSEASVL